MTKLELVHKILDAIDVDPALFDTIVTEAQPKPSAETFLMAIERLGFDTDDAAYVGDRQEMELRPARELGLKTILVNVEKQQRRWAEVIVRSISQLPEALIRFDPKTTGSQLVR